MAFKYSNEYKLYEKQSALDQKYYMQQQKQLNQWNLESAQKQMNFQKTMSDTAHQREVQDLIKAGLNPVLSANNGASTSSGAYANIDSTPLTAASQSRIANRQIAKDLTVNRQNMANAYKIAKYQAKMQFAAQKYATDMSYQLGMAGLTNQLTIAQLPYQEGNINQTSKYESDSNPIHAITQAVLSWLDGVTGGSNDGTPKGPNGYGSALAKLLVNDPESTYKDLKERSKNFWVQPLTTKAYELLENYYAKKRASKNYNVTKKDYLKSMHEYAKGNWNYNSEKWKSDMGYKKTKYDLYK